MELIQSSSEFVDVAEEDRWKGAEVWGKERETILGMPSLGGIKC